MLVTVQNYISLSNAVDSKNSL